MKEMGLPLSRSSPGRETNNQIRVPLNTISWYLAHPLNRKQVNRKHFAGFQKVEVFLRERRLLGWSVNRKHFAALAQNSSKINQIEKHPGTQFLPWFSPSQHTILDRDAKSWDPGVFLELRL